MKTITQPMIKASDLRIGNWVKHIKHGFIKVRETAYMIDVDNNKEGYMVNEMWIDEYEPIPLTPEILENADCSAFGDDEWYSNFKPSWIMRDEGDGFMLVIEGKEFRKIKHVHIYQNLYSALTGEELEINL